jgi:hypothetical protein
LWSDAGEDPADITPADVQDLLVSVIFRRPVDHGLGLEVLNVERTFTRLDLARIFRRVQRNKL